MKHNQNQAIGGRKPKNEPWTKEDFPPVPSVDGAFYHPLKYGTILYTHERDRLLYGPERRGPFRRLLEMAGLRARPQDPVHGGRPGIKGF